MCRVSTLAIKSSYCDEKVLKCYQENISQYNANVFKGIPSLARLSFYFTFLYLLTYLRIRLLDFYYYFANCKLHFNEAA